MLLLAPASYTCNSEGLIKNSHGSNDGAPLSAEVALNLVVMINQTENSEFAENSQLQMSNTNSVRNKSTKNEDIVTFILILFNIL